MLNELLLPEFEHMEDMTVKELAYRMKYVVDAAIIRVEIARKSGSMEEVKFIESKLNDINRALMFLRYEEQRRNVKNWIGRP